MMNDNAVPRCDDLFHLTNQVRPNQAKSNQAKSNQGKSNQVIKLSQIK